MFWKRNKACSGAEATGLEGAELQAAAQEEKIRGETRKMDMVVRGQRRLENRL